MSTSTSTPTPTPTTTGTGTSFFSLPFELRQQVYRHAFADQTLHPLPPTSTFFLLRNCMHCQPPQPSSSDNLLGPSPASIHSLPPASINITPADGLAIFRPFFRPLLTNRQLHAEASPVFYDTLTLHLTDPATLERIRTASSTSTPSAALRARVRRVRLTVHLTDDNRLAWHAVLSRLGTATFPNLRTVAVHNHMRSPTSYDRLVDVIYLCSPLVPGAVGAGLLDVELRRRIEWVFAYVRHEVMFDSPFLGEITTADSIEAHEAVVRDLMKDDGFAACASNEDFEGMTGRLLVVARGHEERWLEGLQRARLGGLTVREVQERMMREQMSAAAAAAAAAGGTGAGMGAEGGGGGVGVGVGRGIGGEDTEDDDSNDGQEEDEEQEAVWEE